MATTDEWGDEITAADLNKSDGEIILSSLSKIEYQTSRHLCINTGLSIGVVVDWLERLVNIEEAVGREYVGSTFAYFLPENKPQGKLYLSGNNSVAVRKEEPRPHTSEHKIGDKIKLNTLPLNASKPPKFTQLLTAIDEAELERLAAINPDKKVISEALGINRTRLGFDIIHIESLGDAFERGEKTYMENQKKNENSPNAEQTVEVKKSGGDNLTKGKTLRKNINWTPALMEELADKYSTVFRASRSLGVSDNSILYQFRRRPELKEAWERGLEGIDSNKRQMPDQTVSLVGENGPEIFIPKSDEPGIKPAEEKPETLEISLEKQDSDAAEPMAENTEIAIVEVQPFVFPPGKLNESPDTIQEISSLKIPEIEFLGRAFRRDDLSVSYYGDIFKLPKEKRELLMRMADIKDEFEK